jgi:hypothetical protein
MASNTPEYEESWRESYPSRFRNLDVEVGSLVCQRTTFPISQRRAGRSGGPACFDATTYVRRNMVERGVKPLKRWRGPPRGTKSG